MEKTLDMARTAHLKLTKSNELDQEQEKPAEMMEGTVLEAPIHRIDIESLEKRKQSMNEKQKEIFEKVMEAVKRPAYDDSSALVASSVEKVYFIFFKNQWNRRFWKDIPHSSNPRRNSQHLWCWPFRNRDVIEATSSSRCDNWLCRDGHRWKHSS